MSGRNHRAVGGDGYSIHRRRRQTVSNASERTLDRFLAGTPPERRPEPRQLLLIELQADLISLTLATPKGSPTQAGAFSSSSRAPGPGVAVPVTPPLCAMGGTNRSENNQTADLLDSIHAGDSE